MHTAPRTHNVLHRHWFAIIAVAIAVVLIVAALAVRVSAGPARPDLTITGIDYQGDLLKFNVRNLNDVDVFPDTPTDRIVVRFQWLGERTPAKGGKPERIPLGSPVTWDITSIAITTLGSAASTRTHQFNSDRQSYEISLVRHYLTRGAPQDALYLRITADADGHVTESNESNNEQVIRRLMPNLSITSVTFGDSRLIFRLRNDPNNSIISTTDRLFVRFQWLERNGNPSPFSAEWDATSRLTSDPPGPRKRLPDGSTIFDSRATDVRSTIHPYLSTPRNIPRGSRTLRITVDPENTVAEPNETNNTVDVPRPLADLTATHARFRDDGSFRFHLKNEGNATAVRVTRADGSIPPFKVRFQWYRGDGVTPVGYPLDWVANSELTSQNFEDGFSDIESDEDDVPGLANFIRRPFGAERDLAYILRVTLDTENAIEESNGENNTAEAWRSKVGEPPRAP